MKHITNKYGETVTIVELCQFIYQGFSQYAVVGFCDAVGWDTWLYCEGCQIESPFTDDPATVDVCLVCGTEYRPKHSLPAISQVTPVA
jgi:hypothetical protein